MKEYSAIVTSTRREYKRESEQFEKVTRIVFFRNQEYRTKSDFIHDLRANGYKVNPKKVKTARVFDYILEHTNMNPWDWDLTEKDI